MYTFRYFYGAFTSILKLKSLCLKPHLLQLHLIIFYHLTLTKQSQIIYYIKIIVLKW